MARLERRRGLLGLVKLANVALAMAWGFVVTFVFVRLLPIAEFRAFLLLVAFANFTISAELGFSSVIYARLRRTRLAGVEGAGEGDFRNEELGVLLLFMLAIVAAGGLLIGAALATRLIPTERPLLFLTFYGASAFNLIAILARRALAALDRNLWWEGLDLVRRVASVALLVAALFGLPILTSVVIQFGVTALAVLAGLATVQRELAMPLSHWWALRAGAGHVRAHYLADIGRTSALTLSDIAAYNAPYFTIVAVTHDPRPLLLFDFVFKVSRGLSALIRAMVETMLPDLTRHFFGGGMHAFRLALVRCLTISLGLTIALAIPILALGGLISSVMFDGKIMLESVETMWISVLLIGLSMMCVSVYLHNGLGRFAVLIPPSVTFLVGSLLSVPLAWWIDGLTGWTFAACFAATYAAVHLALAIVHALMLARLGREGAP